MCYSELYKICPPSHPSCLEPEVSQLMQLVLFFDPQNKAVEVGREESWWSLDVDNQKAKGALIDCLPTKHITFTLTRNPNDFIKGTSSFDNFALVPVCDDAGNRATDCKIS